MAHIKRSYIDSHWLIFSIKGLVAMLVGMYLLFYQRNNVSLLMVVTMFYLLIIAIVDFLIAFFRAHRKEGWGVSVFTAVVEAAVAIGLLLTHNYDMKMSYIVIAVYTALRGIVEIIMAFRTTVDPTDRFIWLISGIICCVTGIVTLNVSEYGLQFFGACLVFVGEANLIYGVHNRSQKIEDHVARVESARKRKKN